jgi:hypothetical protein
MKLTSLILAMSLITACGQNDDRIKEKARLEGESQLSVQNDNLAQKAEAMEKDLARLHKFYQAVKGTYFGTISTDDGSQEIKITLTSKTAPRTLNRVRQLEELSNEINSLAMDVQIVHYPTNNRTAQKICPGMPVKPDYENGMISIPATSDCKNVYILKLSDRSFSGNSLENTKLAKSVAKQILDGDIREVDSLSGTMINAYDFQFVVNKVQE